MEKLDDSDHDADRFFELLAGRRIGAQAAEALREAIVVNAAEHAVSKEVALTERERQDMEATRQHLIAEGHVVMASQEADVSFADGGTWPTRASQAKFRWAVLWENALDRFWGGPLWRTAVIAMGVAGAAGLIVLQDRLDDDPQEVLRGEFPPILMVDDPARTSAQLSERLQALGAQVQTIQLSDQEWLLQVGVADERQRSQVHAVLRDAGVRGTLSGALEVRLRKR